MKKLATIAIVLFATGCGYDGKYRYECQDPQNWETDECNPPLCLVDGMCTETLLGFDPKDTEIPIETVPMEPTTEETVAP